MAVYKILLVRTLHVNQGVNATNVAYGDGQGESFQEAVSNFCSRYPNIAVDYLLLGGVDRAESWVKGTGNWSVYEKLLKENRVFPEGWTPPADCPFKVHPQALRWLEARGSVSSSTAVHKKPEPGKVIAEVFVNPDNFKSVDYMAAVRASCGVNKK